MDWSSPLVVLLVQKYWLHSNQEKADLYLVVLYRLVEEGIIEVLRLSYGYWDGILLHYFPHALNVALPHRLKQVIHLQR